MDRAVKKATVLVGLFAAAASWVGACISAAAAADGGQQENPPEILTVAQIEGGLIQMTSADLTAVKEAFDALSSPNPAAEKSTISMVVKHPSGFRQISYPNTLSEAFLTIGQNIVGQMENDGSRGLDVVTIKTRSDKIIPLSLKCFYDRDGDDQAQKPMVISCSFAPFRTMTYQAGGLSRPAPP